MALSACKRLTVCSLAKHIIQSNKDSYIILYLLVNYIKCIFIEIVAIHMTGAISIRKILGHFLNKGRATQAIRIYRVTDAKIISITARYGCGMVRKLQPQMGQLGRRSKMF